jgi:hypothetical protein
MIWAYHGNIYGGKKMKRYPRIQEEGDLTGRDVGLIGQRQEKVTGYENPMWEAVDRMVEGEYPTTNIGTVAAAARHGGHHPHEHMYKRGGHVRHHRKVEHEQRHYVDGEHERMRENMDKYAHAKHGGHMRHHEDHPKHMRHHEDHPRHMRRHEDHPRHKKHHYDQGGHVPGSTPMKVRGTHPHHTREMDVMEPSHRETGAAMRKGGYAHMKKGGHSHHGHKRHHYAIGGVGKERKGMY